MRFRPLARAFASLALGAALTACHDPTAAGVTSTLAAPRAGPQRALARAATEAQAKTMGCVFGVGDALHGMRTFTVARSAIPFPLPAAETARRSRNGAPVYLLQYASRRVEDAGSTKEVMATCLVPSGPNREALTAAFATLPVSVLRALIQTAEREPAAMPGGSDAPTYMASVLMAPLSAGLRKYVVPGQADYRTAMLGSVAPVGGVRRSFSYTGGVPVLPMVTVYGFAGGGWFLSLGSLRAWLEGARHNAPIGWGFYLNQEDCEDANGFYDELAAEIYQKEQDRLALNNEVPGFLAAATNNSNVLCEKPGDMPGATLCLDAYIRGKIAANLSGDDRGPDPNAKFHQSRVQVYLELDGPTPRARAYPSGTIAWWPAVVSAGTGYAITATPTYYPPSRQQIKHTLLQQVSPTRYRLEVDAWNAMCTQNNTPACYAIQIRMEFEKQSNGQWAVVSDAGSTDYPSVDVYRDQGAGWQPIFSKPEGSWTDLNWQVPAIDQLRAKYEQPLPNGCARM